MRFQLQLMSKGRHSGLLSSLAALTTSLHERFTAAEAAAVEKEKTSAAKSGGRGSNLRRKAAGVEQPNFRISVVFKDARRTLEL